jgi:hypothetical protein
VCRLVLCVPSPVNNQSRRWLIISSEKLDMHLVCQIVKLCSKDTMCYQLLSCQLVINPHPLAPLLGPVGGPRGAPLSPPPLLHPLQVTNSAPLLATTSGDPTQLVRHRPIEAVPNSTCAMPCTDKGVCRGKSPLACPFKCQTATASCSPTQRQESSDGLLHVNMMLSC